MTLIYGLLNLCLHFEHYNLCTDTEEYAQCASFLESKLNESEAGEQYKFILTEEEMYSFEALLNCILKENLDKFILELFNQNISIDALSVLFKETVLYSVYWNDNISGISNLAKIRYEMHRHHRDEQDKVDKKTEQEWNSGCASIEFDEYSNFKLKKIKLDMESGEAEYSL